MWFEIRNQIVSHDAVPALYALCQKNLVLNNPDYVKKKRMGLWTGSTPETLSLYETDGNDVILPSGCVSGLMRAFPDTRWEDYRVKGDAFNYGSKIGLYSYQEDAVRAAVKKGGGIVVAPCGSGKTQIGLEIVARHGVKTLWLTHTQDLLNQSLARAQAVFDCEGYGKITEGRIQIGNGLTFATVQTMAKLDLPKYDNEWGCVVVDECHHCIGGPTKTMQFYKVLSNLSATHKYGLTATPKRSDGMEAAMFALLGGIAHEVSREAVKDTTCPVTVRTVQTGWNPGNIVLCGDGTIDYNELVKALTEDADRARLVRDVVLRIPQGEPVLVLANRVEYLKRLQKMCTSPSTATQCISGMARSKAAREDRKLALQALGNGNIHILFSTYQLAREGLDCPNLRHVIFATPEKDPTTVQQAAGRVGRKADGKTHGTVWDIVDDFGMYLGWAKKRAGIYKKIGYEMT